ncbi:MAG: hypothetical protein ACXU99_15630 [Thermodesulfobacteriota bacterium]
MEQNIIFSEELKKLQKMKEEMDRLWNNLIGQSFEMEGDELWGSCERLPKFEGVGRKSSNPRLNKSVK